MIIFKKAIPRRTALRGIGATLALPLLDGMVPALEAIRNTAAKPVRRLGVVYVPNGMAMEYWTPKAEGSGFELSPILQPLESLRDQLLVLSGLHPGLGGGAHAGAATKFLTAIAGKATDGAEIQDLDGGPLVRGLEGNLDGVGRKDIENIHGRDRSAKRA